MWQANLPMRERGVRSSRTELVADPCRQGEDADQDHPRPGGGNNAPAVEALQDVSVPVSTAAGSEREDMRRETG